MSDQRNLFSTSAIPDSTELKAHAALYVARETAGQAAAEPVIITAPPRVIRQGGAAVARALRERWIEERRAAVVEAADRFGAPQPAAAPPRPVLGLRLADLARLARPERDPPQR